MCEICRQTPCHNRCPYAPEPQVAYRCWQCGNEIYEGEDLYIINDEMWCEECVTECRTTAEIDRLDYDYD